MCQAVDNAKFLGAAEQYIHAIYLEDPGKMRTPIMRLLYTVKMIFNVSTYFNNSVRISSLLVKITNQIIISCKRYSAKMVKSEADLTPGTSLLEAGSPYGTKSGKRTKTSFILIKALCLEHRFKACAMCNMQCSCIDGDDLLCYRHES